MAEIILKNVYKVFDGGVVAVSDFNIWIKDKEFIVLVGPSGCGKSTTLRMIAGLDDITDGSIYIDGVLVNNVPPKDRDIAMVFQDYALYPHMTVYDNIGYGLRLRKFPKRVIDEKVREAAKILAIEDLLKRKPKALSGGQRQRVAIGRAIVRSPKVFLMDEPLSNLDAKLRNQMRAELIKLREKLQTTFIYVTHDQTEAMTLGDRIVIMKDGFVQQIGTPREVFSRPANIFVAGFIGMPQMNFFDGKLEKRGGEYYVYAGNKELMLSSDRRRNFDEKGIQQGDVTVGIRPEHVHVSEKEGPLSGTVEVVEMMGSSMHIHFNFNGKMTIALAGDKDVAIEHFRHGSKVFFDFDEENIHLFGADGANLEYVPKIEEVPEEILSGKNSEIDEDEVFAEEEVLKDLLEAEALSKGDGIKSEEKEKTSFMNFILNKKK